VKKLHGIKLEWGKDAKTAAAAMKEIAAASSRMDCDLCLLALGGSWGPRGRACDRTAQADAGPAGQRAGRSELHDQRAPACSRRRHSPRCSRW
jgi:hypothetical protein